ncbi:hypothetical protein C0991_005039, partial [Blastosporella zonata]
MDDIAPPGDKWAYSFDVVHDITALIEKRGGNESLVRSLDEHFDGGHNDHSNEPSHHIPYLYALAGAAYKTQERVCEIVQMNYNNTPTGLSENEDCGQMSSWYIFSDMGFYPVNTVSGEYIVGSKVDTPIIRYEDFADGGEIVFEMSHLVEELGNDLS